MSAGSASVLVVGEALVDLTRTPDGTTAAHPGGSPMNVAVGLARLDVATTLAAQVGDDEHGDLIRDHVDASDVDLRSLPPHHPDTSTALATLDGDGVATYSFDLVWDPDEMPAVDAFGLVHVGSIAAALEPGADRVETLVRAAIDAGIPVSIDPNVRLDITPDLDAVRDRIEALIRHATYVKLSDDDARVLWPEVDLAEIAHVLLDHGPRLVALTRGDQGAIMSTTTATTSERPPSIAVVDTIGAGDSFQSAMLAGLVRWGWLGRDDLDVADLERLLRVAVTASASTCSRPGADPPTARDLAGLLR
ncbi:fructokinase [Mumia flava]|uniref:Fructokinase n=1 Tax=Mumia flava TaxID=1348852 RepID=A0A0B2B2K4_9ACTN|nr:carbohydrate kinase [Mumia flava]PJJ56788.1 fructokinase [Mumia flava]